MTLEEAIFHAEEVAEGKDKEAYNWEYYYDGNVSDTIAECKKCAAEHRQLAKWLKDYKRLSEQKTVLDKIRDEILEYIDDLDIANEICEVFDKYKIKYEDK